MRHLRILLPGLLAAVLVGSPLQARQGATTSVPQSAVDAMQSGESLPAVTVRGDPLSDSAPELPQPRHYENAAWQGPWIARPSGAGLAAADVSAQQAGDIIVDTADITAGDRNTTVAGLLENPGGDGKISFREAIWAVGNSDQNCLNPDLNGPYTITFDLPAGSVISLPDALVMAGDDITIDGDVNGDGVPDVVIDGPDGSYTFFVRTENNVIKNLAISGLVLDGISGPGYQCPGAHNNQVYGNYIGTEVDGVTSRAQQFHGLLVISSAHDNVIGGTTSDRRNVIAGNSGGSWSGVYVTGNSHDNQVVGNYIGVDVNGNPLPNDNGVWIDDAGITDIGPAVNNVIGGDRPLETCTGPCNAISGNSFGGVTISGAGTSGNSVQGNFVGLDPTGAGAVANGLSGVVLQGGASLNSIGGARSSDSSCAGVCNVISGNAQAGVALFNSGTESNQIQGNFIGAGPSGASAIANGLSGVLMQDNASQNTVGGTRPLSTTCGGVCNVISGNSQSGVALFDAGTDSNVVAGNFIGLNISGTAGVANGSSGVHLQNGPQETTIGGGNTLADGNWIAFNAADGVRMVGNTTLKNTARRNRIYDSPGLGINLVGGANERPDGVTPNDRDDNDVGPNNLMNFPAGVTSHYDPATANTTMIGVLDPTSHTMPVTLDFYALEDAGWPFWGEGERWVGSVDLSEAGPFRLMVPGQLPLPLLSATATDSDGNTSEFSGICWDPDANDDIDNDDDSFCDDWESQGIDYDGDGNYDLDLPGLGADPDHKDMFIESDWMDAGDHNHQPTLAGLVDVADAFDDAPVTNPDSVTGIKLSLLVDESLAEVEPIRFGSYAVQQAPAGTFDDLRDGSSGDPCDGHFGTAAERANAANCHNILGARTLVYRYAVFGHNHAHQIGSSGIAELPGNDFMVTIGGWSEAGLKAGAGNPNSSLANALRIVEGGDLHA